MADPMKTKGQQEPPAETTPPITPQEASPSKPIPDNVADAEVQALTDAQTSNFRLARKNTSSVSVGPMGRRYDASPYVKARYSPNAARMGSTPILGAPDSIVSEDYRRERPGWKYAWPVASHNQTAAYCRSGVYEKVPWDAIDSHNPLAAVAPDASGNTTWGQHLLVAISPYWFAQLYESAEIESVTRSSISRKQLEEELNEQFARGGFAAEADVLADRREERIL